MKSLQLIQQEYLTSAFQLVIPEGILLGVACLLFPIGLFVARRDVAFTIALIGVIGAAVATLLFGSTEFSNFWNPVSGTAYNPRALAPFDPTGPAVFIRWLALGGALIFILLGWRECRDENAADYAACLLVIIAGTSLVARANDLISLFLALEMVSIPTYVMLYLPGQSKAAQEASVKYFLLSVLSSAVLLFGFSYLYGITGTTNLGAILDTLIRAHEASVSPMALIAIIMVIAGLGFRIALVPFHFYAPDVYTGGPTGVIGLLAFIPKVVGIIALARVLGLASASFNLPFNASHTLIPLTLWVLAVITMTFGNIFGLLQENIKRLLAYSGIAHAGYLLIGVVVACSQPDLAGDRPMVTGMDSVLFYLVAYGLMTVGAFAILLHLSTNEHSVTTIDDLAGLGQSYPLAAGTLTVLLFSMIGLPLTAGFIGKFLLFMAAFDAPTTSPMAKMYQILAIIAAINAAIGAVYYLRIVGVMYLRSPLKTIDNSRGSPALSAAVICAIATVCLGIFPTLLNDAAQSAVSGKNNLPANASVAIAGR